MDVNIKYKHFGRYYLKCIDIVMYLMDIINDMLREI